MSIAGSPGAERVTVLDTTLRAGERTPGVALSVSEKVEIATQLSRLGVDVVEAGSTDDQSDVDGVEAVATTLRGVSVAALCRTRDEDVERAWQAVRSAERPRIHTSIPTSPTYREARLRMTPDEVLAEAARAVSHARSLCDDVEFSAGDATRTEVDFLVDVFSAAVESGAGTLTVADTVGYSMPAELVATLDALRRRVTRADEVVWSVLCHDDLGLATANTLAAVRAGARQVEVCVNGLGGRAGGAALEEVVMALRAHRPSLGLSTGVHARELARTSRLVSVLTGYAVPPSKAVVGANALTRGGATGTHVQGPSGDRTPYRVMTAEDVGFATSRVVLGKGSGRSEFVDALAALQMRLTEDATDRAFKRFAELAERKAAFTDDDLVALATEESEEDAGAARVHHFDWLAVAGGTDTPPRATVRLSRGDEITEADATGDGMIDAACNAVATACGVDAALTRFQVAAVTPGTDAVGDVNVQVDVAGQRVNARGVSTDVVEASARAFLHAINKVVGGTAVPHRTEVP